MTLRIVALAPWIPTADAPHAGGQHVWWHVTELATEADVTVVAPTATGPGNLGGANVAAVRFRRPTTGVGRCVRYARWVARGLGPGPQELKALQRFLRSAEGRAIIAAADFIEVQYEEMLPLLSELPTVLPAVLWIHDYVSDELTSLTSNAGSRRRRIESKLRRIGARREEKRGFPRCDGAVVFNPDDVQRLSAFWPVERLRVVRPAVLIAKGRVHGSAVAPTALLVGAFDRSVNRDGLDWLLDFAWPAVRKACPSARLVVAGAGAPHLDAPGVEILGYVKDLAGVYAEADVALAVGSAGGGLKLTIAQALANALPVVATSLAARGYAAPDDADYLLRRDAPGAFASAVADLLLSSDRGRGAGLSGQKWWATQVSMRASSADLLGWYTELVADRSSRSKRQTR